MHILLYIDLEFIEQILSLIDITNIDPDIVSDATFCIKALVNIHPNAIQWAQSEAHLIFLELINECQNDSTLSLLVEKGLQIISLMADAEIQISLLNHGIIDSLISITLKMHLCNTDIFVFISSIIRNISYCNISSCDDDIDEAMVMDWETGLTESATTKYINLMRLANPCLQLGFALQEEEEEEEEEEPNAVLSNSCKFIRNMILIHDWPVMHHLPPKVVPQMISLLACAEQEIRDDIITTLERVIIKFSDDVDTLINEGKLLDQLQKMDEPITDVLTILSGLCRTNHATQIIHDYPQLISKIMDSLSSSENENIIIKSMDCLNNLFESNINNHVLFTKTNYTESLCSFLVQEDCVSSFTEEYHQQYITLFTNTLNILKNMSDSSNMSQNTRKIWNKLSTKQ